MSIDIQTKKTFKSVTEKYKYGFTTDIESDKAPKGLNESIVRLISSKKKEPKWLLDWRLKSYNAWKKMSEPKWPNVKYPKIDYQNLYYYSAPKNFKDGPKSLDEIDPEIKKTYDKLGIPLEEQKRLTFSQAATGASGIETLLPLALELFHNDSLKLNKIIKVLTSNPAKILKINKGTLKQGADADICIFDLEKPWVVKAENLKSKFILLTEVNLSCIKYIESLLNIFSLSLISYLNKNFLRNKLGLL